MPILGIERIWADGKLLRASDGTFNFPATLRQYLGDERQPVDPLIASAEGPGNAPAYRGLAYAVFEDLPLADYGNRIPNLTFEVIADAAPVAVGHVAADLAAGLVEGGGLPSVAGFAAAQAGSVRQALTTLATIADLTLGDNGAALRVGTTALVVEVRPADLGASDRAAIVAERHLARAADLPDAIWLSYGDLARDYQTGIQAATRRSPALRIEQHDLAIAAAAGDAKALAGAALRRAIAARSTAQVAVPWRYAAIRPGDLVAVASDPEPWRVTHRTITGAVIELELARVAGDALPAAAADAGRVYVGPDAPQGTTILHLLDLPALSDVAPGAPQLLAAAGGASVGWRRADILISRDGGDSYAVAASVAGPATIGTLLTTLPPGPNTCWDRASTVDIELASDGADLQSASETAVLAGANVAVIDDEIVQFATAVPIGARRYRLATLLRGRRGSEAAVIAHAAGARFIVLDDRVVPIPVATDALGAAMLVKAVGAVDDAATVAAQAVTPRGVALRPLSPARVTIAAQPNGDRHLSWIRRSRTGFAWTDGTDAPLGEADERYRVAVQARTGTLRTVEVAEPSWTWAAGERAADLAAGAFAIDVVQVSAFVGAGEATRAPVD